MAILKQYLKLTGKMLAFNPDKAFGHALDEVMVIGPTMKG